MSNEHQEPIYRTTPARTGKMLAIMLGICIVGGIIFFSNWDYWISHPAPVVQMKAAAKAAEQTPQAGVMTGKEVPVTLKFIESPDFKNLAFNALPGEEGHNPDIHANVGDKIVFDVTNGGKSFHAFGVVAVPEEEKESPFEHGPYTPIPSSVIASPSNPLKPGQEGHSEFVPAKEGTYYYICTVPGHREQGMQGKIIVDPATSSAPAAAAPPTGVHHDFDLTFIESSDFKTLSFNALPGEEGHNPEIKVKSGDEVTINVVNGGKSFHAFGIVTNPEDPSTVVWNTAIKSASNPLKPKETGSVTFLAGAPGTYYYICTVPGHALQGMKGSFIVE